jgi:hypothetical protein
LSKKVDDFGHEITIAENTVVLGGAVAALEALFFGKVTGKSGSTSYYRGGITLNEALNLSNKENHLTSDDVSYVAYFGVGIYGAGTSFGDVNTPNFKNNALDNATSSPNIMEISNETGLLPLRCKTTLPSPSESNYHATTQDAISGNLYYLSYLKEIESFIVVDNEDSSPDDASYGENSAAEIARSSGLIEAYAKCKFTISTTDIKDYFTAIGTPDQARYNSIGLFMGAYNSSDNEVRDIRLFSYVNFNNVSLADGEEETNYIYRVYAAI